MHPAFVYRVLPFLFAFGLFACSSDEPLPASDPLQLKSYQVSTTGAVVRSEFVFNDDGTIARIDWKREIPNVTQGADVFAYDANGNVIEMVRSITGLVDERIVYRIENDHVILTEHFVNGQRITFIFYDYNSNGQLIHTEESNYQHGSGGFLRGTEREYTYNANGNLTEIKEYSFNEPTAQLVLESVHTFSNFTNSINPLQPVDPLPNIVFQKNLPSTLRVEADGQVKTYTFQYTMRQDGYPSKRVATLNNAVSETLTYEY